MWGRQLSYRCKVPARLVMRAGVTAPHARIRLRARRWSILHRRGDLRWRGAIGPGAHPPSDDVGPRTQIADVHHDREAAVEPGGRGLT